MAIYEYRCDAHGVFEALRPLGTAPASVACAVCGREAQRVISVPAIRSGSGSRSALFAAIERAEKSRYEPEVVTSLPTTGARRRTAAVRTTPALQRLPRP